MRIIKSFKKTETAHIVRNAFSERCKFNFHGHAYFYEVALDGKVQENGMVLDFKQLSPIKLFLDQFDHSSILWEEEKSCLKEMFIHEFDRVLIMKKNPTAENMCRLISKYISEWLAIRFPECSLGYVRIWETENGSAQGNEFDEDDVFTYISKGISQE